MPRLTGHSEDQISLCDGKDRWHKEWKTKHNPPLHAKLRQRPIHPGSADRAYTDECYIDHVDDGYYLFDCYHPGIRLAVVVGM